MNKQALHRPEYNLTCLDCGPDKKSVIAKSGQEKTMLQRQIEAADKLIDKLVYKQYGLTDEEIAIVEEATQ